MHDIYNYTVVVVIFGVCALMSEFTRKITPFPPPLSSLPPLPSLLFLFSAGSVSHASSSFTYHHQHSIASQNSSSITDPDEAPTTGSTIVSENPFYFSAGPNQNGSSQYVNGTIQYGAPYPNATIHSDYPQQIGVKVAAAGSYPLFPIPENTVAMGHFPVSTPVVAVPSHNEATFMTDNPAFEKVNTYKCISIAHPFVFSSYNYRNFPLSSVGDTL